MRRCSGRIFAPGEREAAEEKEREKHGGEAEKAPRVPEKIPGLGDESYLAPLRFGGTLHILKGDRFVRVSIGGPHTPPNDAERLKALALAALKRL